ncbi:hypothetical protein N9L92_05010 [Saprospiraceae bacterium]|nr:hypothetical protein [Saprospiraceae bacterium]
MNLKTLVLGLFSIALITSCNNFDAENELNGNAADIRSALGTNPPIQTFMVDTDNFIIVTSNDNVISAEPGSFVFPDGSVFNGIINFSVLELFNKSDIVRYGFQTLTNDGQILTSDGEFNFFAVADDQELQLAAGAFLNLTILSEEPVRDAFLFNLSDDETWNLIDSTALNVVDSLGSGDGLGYQTALSSMDWVNVDYFTKFDLQLSEVPVQLPDGYNGSNTLVYAIFSDRDIVLLIPYNETDFFSANLPVGEEVNLVAIAAEDSGNFRMDNTVYNIDGEDEVNLDPKSTDLESVIEYLESLD